MTAKSAERKVTVTVVLETRAGSSRTEARSDKTRLIDDVHRMLRTDGFACEYINIRK